MANPRSWNSSVTFSWLLKCNEMYEVEEHCFRNLTFWNFCLERWKYISQCWHSSSYSRVLLMLICIIFSMRDYRKRLVPRKLWYVWTFGSWEHASEAKSCLCLLPPLLPSGLNGVLTYLLSFSVARSVILGPPKRLWPWTHLCRAEGSAVVWNREYEARGRSPSTQISHTWAFVASMKILASAVRSKLGWLCLSRLCTGQRRHVWKL